MTILYVLDCAPAAEKNYQWVQRFGQMLNRPVQILLVYKDIGKTTVLEQTISWIRGVFPESYVDHIPNIAQHIQEYCYRFQNKLRNKGLPNLCIMDRFVSSLLPCTGRINSVVNIAVDKYKDTLFQFNRDYVWKNIRMSKWEDAKRGYDVYGISKFTHRNWRWCKQANSSIPFIPGINGYRELAIYTVFEDIPHPLVPTTKIVKVASMNSLVYSGGHYPDSHIRDMNLTRRVEYQLNHLSEHYVLIQDYAGSTLQHLLDLDLVQDIKRITLYMNRIYDGILMMRRHGIIHGDVTPDNVCIDAKHQVRFIDFGWCTHTSFDLTPKELQLHNRRIQQNFDWIHFCLTVQSEYPELYSVVRSLNELKGFVIPHTNLSILL